jgi:N-acetylmuramoyl-L-alanine amidase
MPTTKFVNSAASIDHIMIERPSPNFGERTANTPIDMLVLHYTGMIDGNTALGRLCDPESKVSAHYCIEEDGTVYHLVGEEHRAWHAGVSYWRGESDINSRSIGIELVNPGHDHGYRPFPEKQMESLISVSQQIINRHPIPPRNVVGHSDIAPDRKQDPGELFDWRLLANEGIGLWPKVSGSDGRDFREMASGYGYDMHAENTVAAFQRHFRPEIIDNRIDEESICLMASLLEIVVS